MKMTFFICIWVMWMVLFTYWGASYGKYRLLINSQRRYKSNRQNNPRNKSTCDSGITLLIANTRSVNNGVLSAWFKATGAAAEVQADYGMAEAAVKADQHWIPVFVG